MWSPQLLSSELFTHVVKKFWSPSSFADPESHHHQPNLGAAIIRQQDTSPWERARGPSFWMENNIPDETPNCCSVPKTDTQRDRKS
jgi:hypothetical protein